MQLQWHRTLDDHDEPTQYHADLPSGGAATLRLDDHVWIASTAPAGGRATDCGVFATAYDGQMAMEAEELQRLISHDIRPQQRSVAEQRRTRVNGEVYPARPAPK